jgi:hypothetical protein
MRQTRDEALPFVIPSQTPQIKNKKKKEEKKTLLLPHPSLFPPDSVFPKMFV